MKVAYVRVSTEEQNEARQIEALKKHGIEKWFTEKISGKSMDRPQLQAMFDYVREAIPSISTTSAALPAALGTCLRSWSGYRPRVCIWSATKRTWTPGRLPGSSCSP